MLDEKDLRAIRGIVKEEMKEEGRNIEKNVINKVGGMITESEHRIIDTVGGMIEENILPQLEVINRRLDQHDKILGWQQ